MNTEKAIEEIISYMHSDAYCDAPSNEACTVAVAALREKLERERNEPLTLDELRKMKDKPVWTVTKGLSGSGRWELVVDGDCEDNLEMASCVDGSYYIEPDTYGETWLAYRRPLKTAMPGEEV